METVCWIYGGKGGTDGDVPIVTEFVSCGKTQHILIEDDRRSIFPSARPAHTDVFPELVNDWRICPRKLAPEALHSYRSLSSLYLRKSQVPPLAPVSSRRFAAFRLPDGHPSKRSPIFPPPRPEQVYYRVGQHDSLVIDTRHLSNKYGTRHCVLLAFA